VVPVTQLPLVIAHRGASGYRPEHSRSAYELAIALGADAVEPDLVASRDGVLVVRHENEISGTTDVAAHPEFAARRTTKTVDGETLTGWFTEDFDWAELATLRVVERIPKVRPANTEWNGTDGILRFSDLLELLDAAPRPVALVAEIKHPTFYAALGILLDELYAAELAAAGWSDDERLTTECFELSILPKIRARGVGGRMVFLIDAKGSPADEVAANGRHALKYASYLTTAALAQLATVVDGISLSKRILLPKNTDPRRLDLPSTLVDSAHDAGLVVFCWTLRAENKFLGRGLTRGLDAAAPGDWMREFRAIMQTGLDGVFADQPDLALEARASLSA